MSTTMEKMTLVPGSRIQLISKANIRYEGTLGSVDDVEGKLSLSHVLSFGTEDKTSQSPTAEHIVYGCVVFHRSELKEVKILDTPKPWPTDPAVVKAVKNCDESGAVEFSKQALTWIEKGDNKIINTILENAHLHRSFDASEKTLLHYAVQYNSVSIVENLLAMGSDINAQDSMGMTPLMMAMTEYKERRKVIGSAMMETILAAGADILLLNKDKKSALHMYCAEYEAYYRIGYKFFEKLKRKCPLSEDVVVLLIDAGCALYHAYEFLKDVKTIELMLQRGVPVDELVLGDGVLHLAIDLRDVECVELLLNHGASVKLENDDGDTPWGCLITEYNLSEIAPEKEVQIVRLLLDRGASLTTYTSDGLFQGQSTLQSAHRNTIRLILENNLDFSATDEWKRSALHFLASNDNPGVAEELKSFKREIVNLNVRDEDGATPLHWAAEYANEEMLKLLLSMGAEVDCRTFKGFTPLHYLCSLSLSSEPNQADLCVEPLLQHHADPQLVVAGTDGERITIFEAASTAGKLSSTKCLVAQVAFSEALGTAINEIVRANIRSKRAREKHLKKCRRLLRREISGSVNLLKLLTSDKRKMAKLLNNEDLVLKLTDNYFKELQSFSSFYCNTLKKRYSDGLRYRNLKNKAAVSIVKIFRENVGEENVIVHRLIDYLDDESLESLKDLL